MYDAGGTLRSVYKVHDGELVEQIALQNGHPLAKWTGSTLTYLHADHLGTPIRGTHGLPATGPLAPGDEVFQDFSTPYGLNPTSAWHGNAASGFNPATGQGSNCGVTGFTTHAKDCESGLTHMQARQYSPVMGRFASVDPMTFMFDGRPGMVGRYSYTLGDPINHTDPDGTSPSCWAADGFGLKSGPVASICNFNKGSTNSLNNFLSRDQLALEASSLTFGSRETRLKYKDRAQLVLKLSGAAAVLISRNSNELPDGLKMVYEELGAPYLAGSAAGGAALGMLTRKGSGVVSRSGKVSTSLSADLGAQAGGMRRAVYGVLNKAEAAGVDMSGAFNTLVNVAVAGAFGLDVDFNAADGSVTATYTPTGSKIERSITICADGGEPCSQIKKQICLFCTMPFILQACLFCL